MQRKRMPLMAVIFGCATLAAFLYSSHLYLYHRLRNNPISIGVAIAESMAVWYAWALLTPVVLYLARRFPLWNRRRWISSLLVHIPAGLLLALLHLALQTLADQVLVHGRANWPAIQNEFSILFARTYHFNVLVYSMIVI